MEVALPVPANDGVFTYRLPAGLRAEPGQRVAVPLGARTATGVVLGDTASARGEIRSVIRVLDEGPLLPDDVVKLCRFAAAHYLAPLGLAIRAALPPGREIEEELSAILTEQGRQALDSAQTELLPSARESVTRTRALLRAVAEGRPLAARRLHSLEKRGLVALRKVPVSARPAPDVEIASAVPGARLPGRAPRQAEVLEWLLARDPRGVPVEELLAAFPGSRPHLRRLVGRGLATLRSEPAGPARPADAPWGAPPLRPSPAQFAALEQLRGALESGGFSPFLLHGATGSGKTLVYMEAIARAREKGKGAIALVPEIALTPQLAGRFRARFGDDVAVLHSGLTERERQIEWHRVRDGRAGIVVGARSAVFAPVAHLGILVVDEEHEPSYKQEERLRYNARDLALVRAKEAGAVAVLGSATPSLETLRRAEEGKLTVLALPERVDGRPPPAIEILDRKQAPQGSLLTTPLARALEETVARGEQAILFLNKRGLERTLLCKDCGSAVGCPNCSVALVLHRIGGMKLRCHFCGHAEVPRACSVCGSLRIAPLSFGTQRLEEELSRAAPKARIARLDRDAASSAGRVAAILARFARHEIDVLVGTQMVAKGHDFPGVTLVGVIDADGPLHLPDFRAAERCVQLLAQVAGRAGRGTLPGRVVLQALRPEDPAVAFARDYATFAKLEAERRRTLRFPPWTRLAALRIQGNTLPRVQGAAERLAARARDAARSGEPIDVLGPAPAPISRLRGKERVQILLRADGHPALRRVARALLSERLPPGVDLAVDIDPASLL
ncbi:MAG: primosomal protein N' [Myxococcales bacterium]